MSSGEKDRVFLTADEAIRRLPEGETIHVFDNPAPRVLVGADWSREAVEDMLRRAERIEESGEQAQAMNHGLAVQKRDRDRECWFVETRKDL